MLPRRLADMTLPRRLAAMTCLIGVGLGVLVGAMSQSSASARLLGRKPSPIRWIAVRQLAHGSLPGQQTYTIDGERYRFQGRVYFTLAISIDRPGEPSGGGGGASFNPSQRQGVFAYSAIVACAPHPYAVLFGLLRAPADRVIAHHGKHATVLQHRPIPSVLHAHGVLAYARLAGPPTEVVVRRPDGERLHDDRLKAGGCSPGSLSVGRGPAPPQG